MILVVIIVPAVQNSMFTTITKPHNYRSAISVPFGIVDASTQTNTMTNNFLVTAYSIAWLGQSNPPFTTDTYTLAPSDLSAVKDRTRTLVTTSTTRFWSEVSCWEPESVMINATSKRKSFADGRGCQTMDVFSDASYWNAAQRPYMVTHIPVDSPGFAFEDGHTRESNISSMCSEYPNRFLSIWWVAGSDPDFKNQSNGLALSCDVGYYKEPVIAKVVVANSSVISFSASGPRELLSSDDFNMTHFKRITGDGSPPNLYTVNGGKRQMDLDINEGSVVQNS